MPEGLVTVSTSILRQRVNKRLGKNFSLSHISQVKHGKKGAASLRDIVKQVSESMILEAADAIRQPKAQELVQEN
jgi:hypothetical protein